MSTTCHVCGEQIPFAEIMDHLRLLHPDVCGDGEVADEIVDATGFEVARITIVRTLTDDDTIDRVEAVDSKGDDLPLTEALGMLRLAEDTVIRDAMGADDE